MKKTIFISIYLFVGFISGFFSFLFFGILVGLPFLKLEYDQWYKSTPQILHLIIGFSLFIIGIFVGIFGLDYLLNKFTITSKLILATASFILILLLLISIQSSWLLN